MRTTSPRRGGTMRLLAAFDVVLGPGLTTVGGRLRCAKCGVSVWRYCVYFENVARLCETRSTGLHSADLPCWLRARSCDVSALVPWMSCRLLQGCQVRTSAYQPAFKTRAIVHSGREFAGSCTASIHGDMATPDRCPSPTKVLLLSRQVRQP